MKPTTLILDAMGVIYQTGDDVAGLLVPFVAGRGGIPNAETIATRYNEASLGKITPEAFWETVGLNPGVEDEYLSLHGLSDGLIEFLGDLPASVRSVWCLSNDVSAWSRKLRERLGIARYFSGFVISGDVGSRKPDPAIFKSFLAVAGLAACDCTFVDDRVKNLDTACAMGFRTVLFGSSSANPNNHQCAASSFRRLKRHLLTGICGT